MLRRGLKTLNELNTTEKTEKIIIAIISFLINDFKFLKILLNPVETATF